ncbi:MAG: F0F1 ATP synthase subunit B [Desulfobacterales bacterium]|jgi:F-type H+-transporting ATPase subunit b|nr:F0F1 ATP synthase subunit B [Desulfobacterales bacterium]
MKFSGFERQFGSKKHRTALIGVLVVLLCLSFGTAMASSGGDSGAKGWVKTDWFRVMNFVVLAGVLVFILRKPVSQALNSRIKDIQEQLESLEAQRAAAEKQLAQYNEKLSQIESEAAKIVDAYIKQGNAAKAKILKEAEQTAEKLRAQARRNIEHEFEKAKQKLQQEVVESSLQMAEESLKKEITAQDQDKLIDEYINKVVA